MPRTLYEKTARKRGNLEVAGRRVYHAACGGKIGAKLGWSAVRLFLLFRFGCLCYFDKIAFLKGSRHGNEFLNWSL